jgi:hypothetical protein
MPDEGDPVTNRSKSIGTAAESAVTKFAKANGFPFAERRTLHGSADCGDVKLDSRGRVVIEVKAGKAAETASDSQIAKWLEETERERVHAGADRAFLVVKRAGKGTQSVGSWWAVSGLDAIADLSTFGAGLISASSGPVARLALADMLALHAVVHGEEE